MTAAQTAMADRLISAKGQTVMLTRRASEAYDPETGSAAITTITQTGSAVILPLPMGFRHSAGTNIPAGSVQCLLSALDLVEPMVDDTLTDSSGKVWAVVEVSPLAPAGDAVLFDLTIRGAQ